MPINMQPDNALQSRIAMVSGHIDINLAHFTTHYLPGIDLAVSRRDYFILGDAQGPDTLALDYLRLQGGPDIKHRITIYPSRPHNIAKFEAMGRATSTDPPEETPADRRSTRAKGRRQGDPRARHLWRDTRMTRASDYDILWTRSGEEARPLYGDKYRPRISATKLNRLRRQEIAEETKIVCREWKDGLTVDKMSGI
jgi:hypothetical protein